MSKPLASTNTFKRRLRQGWKQGMTGLRLEEFVMSATDPECLTGEERKQLQWICEKIVWPVTRAKRKAGNPTPRMFDTGKGIYG